MADVIHKQDPNVTMYTNKRLNNLSQRYPAKKLGKNHPMVPPLDHFQGKIKEQAEAEVVPSSSLVKFIKLNLVKLN